VQDRVHADAAIVRGTLRDGAAAKRKNLRLRRIFAGAENGVQNTLHQLALATRLVRIDVTVPQLYSALRQVYNHYD